MERVLKAERAALSRPLYFRLPLHPQGGEGRGEVGGVQLRSMVAQVVFHERRDEEITVIVTLLAPQGKPLAGVAARRLEHFRIQLIDQELVGQPLIDQDGLRKRRTLHELAGVVLAPGLQVVPQITLEGFLAPGTAHWRGDRCKGRQGFVLAGIAQRADQRAVTPHRVAEYSLPCCVHREFLRD